jgi:ribosomal protein L44E
MLSDIKQERGKKLKINFECQKCKTIFDCDVGQVTMDEKAMRPGFEKKLVCPKCGELTMDDVHLTELGQGQLTEATMDL